MNERTIDLYKQATEFAYNSIGKEHSNTAYFQGTIAGKFAELLIKECGQWFNNRLVVEPDYGLPHRIERNRAVPGVIKEFNEHFGVEE
jgi:hypothetical protein